MTSEEFVYFCVVMVVGSSVTTFFFMKACGYARWAKYPSTKWEEENYKTQKKRLKSIQAICNKHMDSVPQNLQTLDRQILVSYEDLLKIWDKCNHIEDYL